MTLCPHHEKCNSICEISKLNSTTWIIPWGIKERFLGLETISENYIMLNLKGTGAQSLQTTDDETEARKSYVTP